MRAVNLIPSDQRTGGLSGGRSGGMVYVALAALALVLLGASVYALAGRDAKQAEQELAQVQAATQQYQSAAAQYAAYEKAATDATARIQAVKSLAEARFDWAGAMRDLSRVVPATTQVQQMSASVRAATPSTTNSTLRGALDVPAITMLGCARDQRTVADLLTRLQALRRVSQVSLESSARSDATGGGGGGGETSCSLDVKSPYTFTLVVFYTTGASKLGAEAAGTTPTAPGPEAAGGTTTTSSTGN